jgi:2-aminoadipate transaminase
MQDEGYDPLASVQAAGPPGTISFTYGLPDPATFPVDDLRRAADRVFRQRPELALQYGPEQGYGPLIDYIRAKLARDEDFELERSQIMLCGGSSQALDHICTLFTKPGDEVLVEAPTYHESIQLLRDHGLRPLQIPMDNGGLQIEALAERLEELDRRRVRTSAGPRDRALLLYVIPNFQNPSGITLHTERRRPLLALAERHNLLVIEDDVYRDMAYEGAVPPSLFALDGGRRVLRIGSFSKILAPGVRLGWLMGPESHIRRLVGSGLRCMGGGANPLVANTLAEYCRQRRLDRHITHLCEVYRERRDAMLTALENHMPPGVFWTRPAGGYFVWLSMPEPLRAIEVAERARQAKLLIPVGDPFFAETPTGQYLRLAFSYVSPDKIREGIATLEKVLRAGS